MLGNTTEFSYSFDSVKRELCRLGLSDVRLSFFDEITSTNTELKRAYLLADADSKPQLFIAKRQNAGRGRLGRSFLSQDGGIYMSLVLPYHKSGAQLTAYVAVMLAEAIEEISAASVGIKWVNDIYCNGRKLSGILCEGIISPEGRLESYVVGIGINVLKTDFPDELSDIATTLEDVSGKRVSLSLLVAKIAEKLFKKLPYASEEKLMEKYKKKSVVIGKRVKVFRADESFFATAADINEKAELVVTTDSGEELVLNSGEISIKF